MTELTIEKEKLGKILIVLHQATSTPGRVGNLLKELGFVLDIRRPALGDDLPTTLEHHAGAVVFGGPMSVNDDLDFIRTETNWLDIVLRENKPFLGICLGAQMLAKHLGAKVAPHKDDLVEIGWYPIEPTPAGEKLMSWPKKVYQFHTQGFELPPGATLLAGGETYPNQAYLYGENAWGLQFHPELTLAMIHKWTVHGSEHFHRPNAQTAKQQLAGWWQYDPALALWTKQFLSRIFKNH